MNIPDGLPSLAVGLHKAGSGFACVMQHLSYVNGDVKITDMPSCTHPVLAKVAQVVNDNLCTHRGDGILCSDCAGFLLRLEPRLIGTAPTGTVLEQRVFDVRLAVWCAERVLPLIGEDDRTVCVNALEAARAWADDPCEATRQRADKATYAAYAVVVAVSDAYAASHIAYIAHIAAANAADAAAKAARAAANAAKATANAARAAANAAEATDDLRGFITGLLDYYDTLVAPREVMPLPEWTALLAEAMR